GFDPIAPGTPRDSWGVSAGAVGGAVDPAINGVPGYGSSNIVPNGAPVFTANTGSISTFLNAGAGNLLPIDQGYSFAANILPKLATTVTTVRAPDQAALFKRNVNYDVALPAGVANELTNVPGLTPPVTAASPWGFEMPSPLDPFVGAPNPGPNLGGAIRIDLG